MPDDPPTVDQRQRRSGLHRPVVTLARSEPPWQEAAAEVRPSTLPAWPFRRIRPGLGPGPDDAPAGTSLAASAARQPEVPARRLADATATAAPVAPARPHEFRADRAAARYAPEGASFVDDGRSLPVLTVSMSGISIRWGAGRMPAVGARLEGEVAPAGTVAAFGVQVVVARVEPERRLVAGRFVSLSGTAIDRLLSWLSRLDRAAGRTGPA